MVETSPKIDSNRIRQQLLAQIRTHAPISRAALAAATRLTRPTVSSIVDEFVSAGLVRESGKGESTGGKRPILLELTTDRHCAIGIDLGEDFLIRGVRMALNGTVCEAAALPYRNEFSDILAVVVKLVRQLAAAAAPETIRGVGIAVSGVVDRERNEVICASTLDLENRDFARRLREAIQLPVLLEKRPTAAALAERADGSRSLLHNLVYLTSGRGIGAGIIINGKQFRGSFGRSGEFGVMPMLFPGDGADVPTLETRLRAETLAEQASAVKHRPVSYAELLQLGKEGDPEIRQLIADAARKLAAGARLLVDLLDPEAIILGGPLLELGHDFFDAFRDALLAPGDHPELQVLPSRFRNYGAAAGGAAVILEEVFDLRFPH